MSASILALQCLAQGCKVAEKRVSTYAGIYEARALKVWRDAGESRFIQNNNHFPALPTMAH